MEENPDMKLLKEWGDVQVWQVNFTPAPHRRLQAATYVVQVLGQNAEAFKLPSAAWKRFKELCDAKARKPPEGTGDN
jgi:hypothetical protein